MTANVFTSRLDTLKYVEWYGEKFFEALLAAGEDIDNGVIVPSPITLHGEVVFVGAAYSPAQQPALDLRADLTDVQSGKLEMNAVRERCFQAFGRLAAGLCSKLTVRMSRGTFSVWKAFSLK